MNTWQRFTERARRIVFFAQEEAGRLGEHYVSSEHLLLGLLREPDPLACRILDRLGILPERVRAEIELLVAKGDGTMGQEMQLTPRAKRVIDLAYDEARQLNNNYIGSEHMLLGLIREAEGLAGRVLLGLGADLEKARQIINDLQSMSADKVTESISERAVSKLLDRPGVLGILKSEDRAVVEAALEYESLTDLLKVFQAQDGVGYRELIERGNVLLLPTNTEAKRLAHNGTYGLCIRLRSGEHKDKVVWVFSSSFQAVKEDDEPFPPTA
jgi:hypothetical protein